MDALTTWLQYQMDGALDEVTENFEAIVVELARDVSRGDYSLEHESGNLEIKAREHLIEWLQGPRVQDESAQLSLFESCEC